MKKFLNFSSICRRHGVSSLHAVVLSSVLLCVSTPFASEPRWYEFKGLYVGLKGVEAKKLGFNNCKKGLISNETCERDKGNHRFSTIGAVPIDTMSISIGRNNLVELILIETNGAFWDDLVELMKKRYGKPKKENATKTNILWDHRSAEYISGNVAKGKTTLVFGYSEIDSEEHLKRRAKQGAKDF